MIFVTATPNTLGGFIYTRSEYNAKGQLTKQYQDTGSGTESTAPTLYEYDAFGNMVKQTLALSATLASKSISTDVRGNVSMNWAEYTAPAKVTSFSSVPGSNIIAEVVTVDGLTISQTDSVGITSGLEAQDITTVVDGTEQTTSLYRRHTATGMEIKQRDGRGNVSTTVTDAAGVRTLSYNAHSGQLHVRHGLV